MVIVPDGTSKGRSPWVKRTARNEQSGWTISFPPPPHTRGSQMPQEPWSTAPHCLRPRTHRFSCLSRRQSQTSRVRRRAELCRKKSFQSLPQLLKVIDLFSASSHNPYSKKCTSDRYWYLHIAYEGAWREGQGYGAGRLNVVVGGGCKGQMGKHACPGECEKSIQEPWTHTWSASPRSGPRASLEGTCRVKGRAHDGRWFSG